MYPKGTYHFIWQEFKSGSMLHVEFSTYCYIKLQNLEKAPNKKVLLCEYKRHTTCHVASARAGTYLGQVGVPILGYPLPLSWCGQGKGGTYLGWGVPTMGYPSPSQVRMRGGVPTLAKVPLPRVWTDRHLWNYQPIINPMSSVGSNKLLWISSYLFGYYWQFTSNIIIGHASEDLSGYSRLKGFSKM